MADNCGCTLSEGNARCNMFQPASCKCIYLFVEQVALINWCNKKLGNT